MRFLADENVPLPSVFLLRAAGVDIAAVAEVTPGAIDADVLADARRGDRLLVTFDRDFGELVYRRGADGQPGVIYCRFVPQSPTETGELLLRALTEAGGSFLGQFTVVDRDQVRRRPLPRPAAD